MRLIFVLLLFNFTILKIFGSQTSGTWTVTADETLTGEVELSGDLTVNGGGYTLTAATGKRLFKTGSHKLILNNVKLTGGDPSGATTGCSGGDSNSDDCSGGAVLVVGGTLEASDSEFLSSKGFMGSAIFARNGATVTLTDCKVNNNENTKSNPDNYCAGGAVTISQSTTNVHIIRGEVNNNDIKHPTSNGCKSGGLYATSGHFNVTGTTIKGNKGRDGAGIYIYQGSISLTDAIVEDNTAELRGGGIHIYEGEGTITNTIIKNNEAKYEGGGIVWQGWGDKLTTITGSTIEGNKRTGVHGATNYDIGGGGICIGVPWNYKVKVEIRETTFKDNNDADGNGHHIFTKRSTSDKPLITLVNNEYLGATGNILGGHEDGTDSATNFASDISPKACLNSPCTAAPFTGTCADLTDNKGVTCDCASGTLEPSTYGSTTCCGPAGCSAGSGGDGGGGGDSKITLEFSNNGSSDYVYDSQNDPDISLCLNQEYEFKRTTSGHTLRLVKDSDCTGCDTGTYSSLPTSSVTGWTDASSGSPVDFTFTEAGTYYYVCVSHSGMVGKITVNDCNKCAINEHVVDNACVACPSGQVNIAGDDPSGANTTCVAPCGKATVTEVFMSNPKSTADMAYLKQITSMPNHDIIIMDNKWFWRITEQGEKTRIPAVGDLEAQGISMAVDKRNGYIYYSSLATAQYYRIFEVTTSGAFSQAYGTTQCTSSMTSAECDGVGKAAKFQLNRPGMSTIGKYMYVADSKLLRRIDLDTQEVTTLAGDPSHSSYDTDGTGSTIRMYCTTITDDGTDLYLHCMNNKIRKYVISTGTMSTITTTTIGYATDRHISYNDGKIYITQKTRTYEVVDVSAGTATTVDFENEHCDMGGIEITGDTKYTLCFNTDSANSKYAIYKTAIDRDSHVKATYSLTDKQYGDTSCTTLNNCFTSCNSDVTCDGVTTNPAKIIFTDRGAMVLNPDGTKLYGAGVGLGTGKNYMAFNLDAADYPIVDFARGYSDYAKYAILADNKLYRIDDTDVKDQKASYDSTNSDLITDDVIAVHAGQSRYCAILSGGKVQCAGYRTTCGDGRCGWTASDTMDYQTPHDTDPVINDAVLIQGFKDTTVVKRSNGKWYCWGENRYNRCGCDTSHMYSWETWYLPCEVKMVASSDIKDMQVGYSQTVVLKNNGDVVCWGHGSYCGATRNQNTVHPYTANLMIQGASKIASGAGGRSYAIVDNELYTWSGNIQFATKILEHENPIIDVMYVYGNLCINNGVNITCRGSNQYGGYGSGLYGTSTTIDLDAPVGQVLDIASDFNVAELKYGPEVVGTGQALTKATSCSVCPMGSSRTAGDNPRDVTTECTCDAGWMVQGDGCQSCGHQATLSGSKCVMDNACAIDEYVAPSYMCIDCNPSTYNFAGDTELGTCDDPQTCLKDEFVDGGTCMYDDTKLPEECTESCSKDNILDGTCGSSGSTAKDILNGKLWGQDYSGTSTSRSLYIAGCVNNANAYENNNGGYICQSYDNKGAGSKDIKQMLAMSGYGGENEYTGANPAERMGTSRPFFRQLRSGEVLEITSNMVILYNPTMTSARHIVSTDNSGKSINQEYDDTEDPPECCGTSCTDSFGEIHFIAQDDYDDNIVWVLERRNNYWGRYNLVRYNISSGCRDVHKKPVCPSGVNCNDEIENYVKTNELLMIDGCYLGGYKSSNGGTYYYFNFHDDEECSSMDHVWHPNHRTRVAGKYMVWHKGQKIGLCLMKDCSGSSQYGVTNSKILDYISTSDSHTDNLIYGNTNTAGYTLWNYNDPMGSYVMVRMESNVWQSPRTYGSYRLKVENGKFVYEKSGTNQNPADSVRELNQYIFGNAMQMGGSLTRGPLAGFGVLPSTNNNQLQLKYRQFGWVGDKTYACNACRDGYDNAAGDTAEAKTQCDFIPCKVNQQLVNGRCSDCPTGTSQPVDGLSDPTVNTFCTRDVGCAQNEYVSTTYECTSCDFGYYNNAGDVSIGECDDTEICDQDEHVANATCNGADASTGSPSTCKPELTHQDYYYLDPTYTGSSQNERLRAYCFYLDGSIRRNQDTRTNYYGPIVNWNGRMVQFASKNLHTCGTYNDPGEILIGSYNGAYDGTLTNENPISSDLSKLKSNMYIIGAADDGNLYVRMNTIMRIYPDYTYYVSNVDDAYYNSEMTTQYNQPFYYGPSGVIISLMYRDDYRECFDTSKDPWESTYCPMGEIQAEHLKRYPPYNNNDYKQIDYGGVWIDKNTNDTYESWGNYNQVFTKNWMGYDAVASGTNGFSGSNNHYPCKKAGYTNNDPIPYEDREHCWYTNQIMSSNSATYCPRDNNYENYGIFYGGGNSKYKSKHYYYINGVFFVHSTQSECRQIWTFDPNGDTMKEAIRGHFTNNDGSHPSRHFGLLNGGASTAAGQDGAWAQFIRTDENYWYNAYGPYKKMSILQWLDGQVVVFDESRGHGTKISKQLGWSGSQNAVKVGTYKDKYVSCQTCEQGKGLAAGSVVENGPNQCALDPCQENFHIKDGKCTACPTGATRPYGDSDASTDTYCTCGVNQFVSSNTCTSCPSNTNKPAGDDSSGADTACLCDANYHVVSNTCTQCPGTATKAAGDDSGGVDTHCICGTDQYVNNNVCTDCPSGTTRPAGDDSAGNNTVCILSPCAKDYHVVGLACVACPAGKSNEAGDTNENGDTYCDSDEKCQENERVVSQTCKSCPPGKFNMPGDEPHGPDTTCDWSTCAKDEYSMENTIGPVGNKGRYLGNSATALDMYGNGIVYDGHLYAFEKKDYRKVDVVTGTKTLIEPDDPDSSSSIVDTDYGEFVAVGSIVYRYGGGWVTGTNGGAYSNVFKIDIAAASPKWEHLGSGGSSFKYMWGNLIHYDNKLWTFGGWKSRNQYGDTVQHDAIYFDLSTNTWSTISESGSTPSDTKEYGLVMRGSTVYKIYGEKSYNNYEYFIWTADLDDTSLTWTKLTISSTNRPAGRPRFAHGLYGDTLVMVGGNYKAGIYSIDLSASSLQWEEHNSDTGTDKFDLMSPDTYGVIGNHMYIASGAWVNYLRKINLLSGNSCESCTYGTFNEAGDSLETTSTCDAADVCETNEHVSFQFLLHVDQQMTNAAGYNNAITDFDKAQRLCIADSTCKGLTKDSSDNYYLSDGTLSANTAYDAYELNRTQFMCHTCAHTGTRVAGDIASAGETSCTYDNCAVNERVIDYECKACPANKLSSPINPSVGNAVCTFAPCGVNEHVGHPQVTIPSASRSEVKSGWAEGHYPEDINVGPDGKLYIVEGIGKGNVWICPEDGSACSAWAHEPTCDNMYGIDWDSDGNAYVSCTTKIVKVDTSGTATDFITGLTDPQRVRIDSSNNLYVNDYTDQKVYKYALPSTTQVQFGGEFITTRAMTLDRANNVLYIGHGTYSSSKTQKIAKCPLDGTCDMGWSTGHYSIYGLAVDAIGNVYEYDNAEGKLFKAAASDGARTEFYGSPVWAARNGVVKDGVMFAIEANSNGRLWKFGTGAGLGPLSCVGCPEGQMNDAGDLVEDGASQCTVAPCNEDHYVLGTYSYSSDNTKKYGSTSCTTTSDCETKCTADENCNGYTQNPDGAILGVFMGSYANKGLFGACDDGSTGAQTTGTHTWYCKPPNADLTDIVQLRGAQASWAVLKSDGSVKSWGREAYGGGTNFADGVAKLVNTLRAYAVLKDDGTVTVWGDDAWGGCDSGAGSSDYTCKPSGLDNVVDLITNMGAIAAIKSDGSVVTWGKYTKCSSGNTGGSSTNTYRCLTSNTVDNVAKVVPNMYAFAAIKNDGAIVSWGRDNSGGSDPSVPAGSGCQYNNGNYVSGTNCPTKLFGNGNAMAALMDDGSIKAWGKSDYGGTSPSGTGFVDISGSGQAFAALKPDGSIATWGRSGYGGDNGPSGTGFVSIVGNDGAFAALKDDGSIEAWGASSDGGTGEPTSGVFTKIVANYEAFAALKDDGSITAWGYSNGGGCTSSSSAAWCRPSVSNAVDIVAPTRPGYSHGASNTFGVMLADGTSRSWGNKLYTGTSVRTGTLFLGEYTQIVWNPPTYAYGPEVTGTGVSITKTLNPGGTCTACPGAGTRPAGDKPADGPTSCDFSICGANEHVVNHACVACAAGTFNDAGDSTAVANTACDDVETCDANEYGKLQYLSGRLASGAKHTCVILEDDTVKCWGEGDNGRLGYGDTSDRGDSAGEMGDDLPAVDLGTGKTAKQLTAGGTHTCVILDDDTVKCWGNNQYGKLGYIGETDNRGDASGEMGDDLLTVDLGSGKTAKQLATGMDHTCAILNDDTVKCWGRNDKGQLGYEDTTHRGSKAGDMGDDLPTVDLGTGKTAKQITAGLLRTCVILNDDTVKCWGRNNYGQLGYEDTDQRGDGADEMGDDLPAVDLGTGKTAKQISSGPEHTCAILNDDTVKCWGWGYLGVLGYEDYMNKRGDGADEMGDDLPAVDLGTGYTAKQIVAGQGYTTCVILNDDKMKCWGHNGYGQLGIEDNHNRGDHANEMGDDLPVIDLGSGKTAKQMDAGENFVCAILNDYTVKCWGRGDDGRRGSGNTDTVGLVDGDMGDDLAIVDLGTGKTVPVDKLECTACPGAGTNDAAKVDSGTTCTFPDCQTDQYSDGDGICKACPIGRTMPTPVNPSVASQCLCASGEYVSSGACTSCPSGFTNVAGDDPAGAATTCDFTPCAVNHFVEGSGHSRVCTACPNGEFSPGGEVTSCSSIEYCSIDQKVAEVYTSDRTKKYGSTACTDNSDCETKCDADSSCLGYTSDKYTPLTLAYLGGCLIQDTNAVICWGKNAFGQVGDGSTTERNAPVAISEFDGSTDAKSPRILQGGANWCALLKDGTVKCWGHGKLGDGTNSHRYSPVTVAVGGTVIDLGGGSTTKCALLDDGTIKCWGDGTLGQIGNGESVSKTSPTAISLAKKVDVISKGRYDTICVIFEDGSTSCWGWNNKGQLCDGTRTNRNSPVAISELDGSTDDKTAVQILCSAHCCAVMKDSSLKCWGFNDEGQVGDGTRTDVAAPKTIDLGTDRTAVKVSVGDRHTCALLDDGSVKCWGKGDYGALGHGGGTDKLLPTLVSGIDGSTSAKTAIDVSCAKHHTGIVLENNDVRTWGFQRYTGGGNGQGTEYVPEDLGDPYSDSKAISSYIGYGSVVTGTGNSFTKVNDCVNCPEGFQNEHRNATLKDGPVNTCTVRNCVLNEFSDGSICKACPAQSGAASDGLDPTAGATQCTAITCATDQYVESGECKVCDSTSYRAAGDEIFGADTHCFCKDNHKVINKACVACEAGSSNPNLCYSGLQDHYCVCDADYHVVNKVCTKCPAGTTRSAGDYGGNGDTYCLCGANQHVVNNVCTACPAGATRAAGDDSGGANTYCTCGEDQHVVSNVCTPCAAGSLRPAGDDSSGADTSCSCKANEHVKNISNVLQCSACPAGSVRAAGDFPADGVTSCACPADFHVSGGECKACVGGTRAAGDDPTAGDTHCTCNADHKVVSNVCTACPAGQERAAGDDAGGADTTCLCKENFFSNGDGTCSECGTGAVLAAGSDPAVASQCQCGAGFEINGANCDACAATEESVAGEACKCKENHFYDGSACTACAAGSTNPAGDDKSATTSCTATLCAENERVVSHVCTPCTTGMIRAAGDDATSVTDTECAHQGTAHKVELSGNFGYKIDSGTTNGKLVIRKGSGLHTFYRDSAGNPMRIVSEADCAGSDCDKATYSTLPTSSLGLDDAEKDVAVTVFDPDTAGIGTYYYMSTTNGYRKGRIIVKPKLCKDLAVPLTSATTGTYTLTESCELDFTFTLTVDLTITFSLARLRAQSGEVPTIFAKEGERHFHVSSGAKLSLTNIELKGGSPSGDGGSIKCDKCELEMDNVKMTDNTAGATGGAIHVSDSTSKVTLSNTLFSGNQGTSGGAIRIVDANTVTISDSDFNSNTAATGDGGAIESSKDMTVSGTAFLENNANAGDGGAIKMFSAKLTASGSSFRRNRAKRGGAFKSNSGAVDFSNMVLEENEAVEDGGAIDFEGDAEIDIRLTTMKKNKAKRGGAIRSKGTSNKKFRIRSSSLEENEASVSGGGGAVDLDGTGATKFMFQDSTMTGNKAAGSDNDFKKRGSSVKILAIDSDLDDAKIDGGTRDSECVTDQCTGRADSTCKTRTGGTTCECNSGKYLHTDKTCHTHKVCTGLGINVQIKAPTATNDRLCGSPDVAEISYVLDDKGKELAALVEKRLIADGVSADAAYALAVEVFGEIMKCE